MAYSRKTWVDRESEYPTRRILTNTSSGTEQQVTVTRDEGTVSVAGDSFDAQTMNNFEGRIASEFTNQGSAIGTLSNLTTDVKTDLVSAINEVKSDIPVIPTIPQDLDDLGDINKPAGGVLDGSVPCWDVTHSEYDIRQPDASEVTYDKTASQPTGTVGDAVQDLQADMTNEIARIDGLYDYYNTNYSSGSESSEVTVSSGMSLAWTNITSVTLTRGLWLLIGNLNFAKNATGIRCGLITTTSSSSSANLTGTVMLPAAGADDVTRIQVVTIVNVTSASQTYYVEAKQNSGGQLKVKARIVRVMLK